MALSSTGSYPASFGLFTAGFKQPSIPEIATELRGSFMQHKWDEEVSHITSGYWYNSAAQGKVRVDEAYEGAYGSSLFDYTNVSSSGAIRNHLKITSLSIDGQRSCFDEYVEMPGFALITADLLQSSNATFGGIVQEPFLGETQTWNFLYANSIPVIAYLNHEVPPMLLGYDFWGSEKRTKVVTRFFAQQTGNISERIFDDFVCPKDVGAEKEKGLRGTERDSKLELN